MNESPDDLMRGERGRRGRDAGFCVIPKFKVN
jgi:hypothetical protein